MAPKGPPINPEVVFSDILASRLNSLHGFETLYVQLFRHDRIQNKVLDMPDIFDISMTSSISYFHVILQFLATSSVISV